MIGATWCYCTKGISGVSCSLSDQWNITYTEIIMQTTDMTDYRLYISALSTLELLWICPACDPWLCCACFSQSLLSPPPQGNPRFSASESGQITSAHLGNHVSGTSYGQIFNQSILQIAGWFQLKITSALPPHYVPRPQLSLDASPGNCGTIPRPHLLRQTDRLIFIKHRMMLSSCS